MNYIIDPKTNKKYNIFSTQGKNILKKMVTSFMGGMFTNDELKNFNSNPCFGCAKLREFKDTEELKKNTRALQAQKNLCKKCAEKFLALHKSSKNLGIKNTDYITTNLLNALTAAEKAKNDLIHREVGDPKFSN